MTIDSAAPTSDVAVVSATRPDIASGPRPVLVVARESVRTARMLLEDATETLARLEDAAVQVAATAQRALELPRRIIDATDRELLADLARASVKKSLELVRAARASVEEWTRNTAASVETLARLEERDRSLNA